MPRLTLLLICVLAPLAQADDQRAVAASCHDDVRLVGVHREESEGALEPVDDRAHRLGQDKPVFVYKLIIAGSIEEKILSLQERKADLAAGILSADHNVELKFGVDDLAALFSPLPS